MIDYKVKAIHTLVDVHSDREVKSILSMKEISKYGVEYIQNINEKYHGDEWETQEPLIGWMNHSADHYGAFQSFKKGIIENFTEDLDAILIFEANCVLNINMADFITIVNKAIEYCNEHDISYLSFGDRGLPTEVVNNIYFSHEVENTDSELFMITNQIVSTHCILFTQKSRNFLINNLNKSWGTTDLWLNRVYKDAGDSRLGIIRNPITYQEEGQSMIDRELPIEESQTDHVCIILAHVNSAWKNLLLEECINSIQKFETILSCNSTIDHTVMNKFNWVIYSHDNPIVNRKDFTDFNINSHYVFTDVNGVCIKDKFEYDHTWSVYNLILNGLRYAKSINKKTISIINYDYKIDGTIIDNAIDHLREFDLVVYDQEHLNGDGYCTGFIHGKIDTFFEFFEFFTNINDFYQDYNLLEYKMKSFYDTRKVNIKHIDYNSLKETCLLDREGIPPFNKQDPTFNRFKIISDMYNCEKTNPHTYDRVYPNILDQYIDQEISLLEIGAGYGNSIKVWGKYLPKANIWGIDVNHAYKHGRGQVFKADQSNIQDLKTISSKIPLCEIIIDDGSHVIEHQIISFEYLFKNVLKDGGYYIIENIETSYWGKGKSIYGYTLSGENIIEYFNKLNHSVNSEYNGYNNDYNIENISYSSNCIVIKKLSI